MKISAVVPAYNEAERIISVLKALEGSKLLNELIVVNDGSTDQTPDKVKDESEAFLVNLEQNSGKANALIEGVKRVSYPNLLFVDADLVGFKTEHVDKMIRTFQEKQGMVIGVFHRGRLNTDLSQKISPHLSGQRILSFKVWNKLDRAKVRQEEFGLEMALTKLALDEDINTTKVKLTGVSHIMKEEKRGFMEGIKSRLKMYRSILKATWLSIKPN